MSHSKIHGMGLTFAATLAMVALFRSDAVDAEPLGYVAPFDRTTFESQEALPVSQRRDVIQTPADISARLRRHVVDYPTRERAGTIVIDTWNTYLYYVLGSGKAIRYGIGVGREGFTWAGVKAVERKAEWPDWIPPEEMLQRQPYLPRFMAGGPGNPLGARAMYLGGTVYRIHGTDAPSTIGKPVSSGCIRMLNDDVIDLYGRVNVGTKVIVLPMRPAHAAAAAASQDQIFHHATRSAVANANRMHGIY